MNEQTAKSEEKNVGAGGPVLKTGDGILSESDLSRGAITSEQLTGIQQAGMRILLFVGALGAVVIVGLGVQFFLKTPRIPTLDPTKDANYVANVLGNYKEISGAVLSQTKDLFEMVVVKILYPLATLVLGYVFGKRSVETKQD